MTRPALQLSVYRLLTCLAATNRIAEVELTRVSLPIEYDPTPLSEALDRLTESVKAVREALANAHDSVGEGEAKAQRGGV